MPGGMSERDAIVLDPMLATGHSAVAAVERLKETKPRSIRFVCLVSCPEGIRTFQAAHPDVPIYTAAIDRELEWPWLYPARPGRRRRPHFRHQVNVWSGAFFAARRRATRMARRTPRAQESVPLAQGVDQWLTCCCAMSRCPTGVPASTCSPPAAGSSTSRRASAPTPRAPSMAQGYLLTPPFVDAHFHMDATLSLRPAAGERERHAARRASRCGAS